MNTGRATPRSIRQRIVASALGISAALAPVALRLRRESPEPSAVIHVIGDSHVSLFSGSDAMVDAWPRRSVQAHERFRTYRLGSVLAYRLPDLRTTSRGRERLLTVLAFGDVAPGATVLLSFGEIDCRYHLPRQVELTGRSADTVVRECVRRYADVVRQVSDWGFRTLVWGVVPSLEQDEGEENPEYPHWGTAETRNVIIRMFNALLSEELAVDGVPVVSLFDQVLGPDGLPDRRYYLDAVHLSSAVLPLALTALDQALGVRSHASHTKS